MLHTLYIGVSGRENDEHELTLDGLDDMRWMIAQLAKEHTPPRLIYTTPHPAALASAYMVAGGLPSVEHVVCTPRLLMGPPRNWKARQEREEHFRRALAGVSNATIFFQMLYPFERTVETILFLSDDCWGNAFGEGATWPRGAIYAFNLKREDIRCVGDVAFSI